MMVRREVQGVIFDIVNGEEMILLVKKKDRRNRRFYWRLLKGGIENNESEVEALKREIFEETGLKRVHVVKRVYGYEFIFRGVKHVVSSFLVKADSTEAIRLQKTEVAETMWLPKNQALKTLYWKNEKEALKRLDIQELL